MREHCVVVFRWPSVLKFTWTSEWWNSVGRQFDGWRSRSVMFAFILFLQYSSRKPSKCSG